MIFFRGKSDTMEDDYYSLFNEYSKAAGYRNNIAHGICYGHIFFNGVTTEPGWFLFPPQYNTRKRSSDDAQKIDPSRLSAPFHDAHAAPVAKGSRRKTFMTQ